MVPSYISRLSYTFGSLVMKEGKENGKGDIPMKNHRQPSQIRDELINVIFFRPLYL